MCAAIVLTAVRAERGSSFDIDRDAPTGRVADQRNVQNISTRELCRLWMRKTDGGDDDALTAVRSARRAALSAPYIIRTLAIRGDPPARDDPPVRTSAEHDITGIAGIDRESSISNSQSRKNVGA
jgi:hypothetical protein